jgi:hypothetical protein
VKLRLAAEATDLGLTLTKCSRRRRLGDTDYISVAALNAFISGRAQWGCMGGIQQPHPIPNSANAEPIRPLVTDSGTETDDFQTSPQSESADTGAGTTSAETRTREETQNEKVEAPPNSQDIPQPFRLSAELSRWPTQTTQENFLQS